MTVFNIKKVLNSKLLMITTSLMKQSCSIRLSQKNSQLLNDLISNHREFKGYPNLKTKAECMIKNIMNK